MVVVGTVVGKCGMEEIGIVVQMGKVMVSKDVVLHGGGGGVRFINGSWIMEAKISKVGGDDGGEDDTFGIGSEVGGSEAWSVLFSSRCWSLVGCTSDKVLSSESS